jgi:adhesin/invasin
LGAVSPGVVSGAATPLSPLVNAVNSVTVTIGGQPAEVKFAGLTPGFAGLYQVNAVVPAGVSGNAVPVVLQVSGQTSTSVAMAVR